jgi:hypothetical protein
MMDGEDVEPVPHPATGGCPMAAARASRGAWPPPGFRHLFPGLPPPLPPMLDEPERKRLVALSRAMQAPLPFHPSGDNPRIPAGYTYLMQFVAHDMVRTETPIWGIGTIGRGTRDLATARLRLDTLYGGGPIHCPFAYMTGARARLRISPIAPDARHDDAAGPPRRDIPRARFDPPPPGWPKTRPPPLDEALLADPRNDDNSNVAQITVLFSALHNAIVDRLEAARGDPDMAYAVAREAATLVYRRILREDLLPKLLHPAVMAHYAGARGADFLDAGAPDADAMALEFCAGAFRCGHAMVRESYHINDATSHDLGEILRATSGAGAAAMPLNRTWIIRWSRFFALGGRVKPNPSRRLRPQHSPGLLDARIFRHVDDTQQIGLTYRDLLVAGLSGLHSVAALWDHVAQRLPALAAAAPLAGPERRRAALRAWMDTAGLAEADAAALSAEPPLPFYVLFEAEAEREGLCLGTLGSVIVAETILGILDRDPLPSAQDGADPAAALARLAAAADVRPAALAPLARIADMRGLVRFAARAKDIGADNPVFI